MEYKVTVIIEQVNESDSLAWKFIFWFFIGWWLIPLFILVKYALYIFYILPFKLVITGFREKETWKIIVGIVWIAFTVFLIWYGQFQASTETILLF